MQTVHMYTYVYTVFTPNCIFFAPTAHWLSPSN